MEKNAKIYIAGHSGLIGSALKRTLTGKGYGNILIRTHRELDLTRQSPVEDFFKRESPEYVFIAAAKVGGIKANNTYPAQFIYENLAIQTNIIHAAYVCGVKKLLFLGSACAYPRECPQPMKEEYLLSGYLEPTNEPYAVAKIAGIKMCQAYNRQYKTNFICAVATNAYGPFDHFVCDDSHVIPALIKKLSEAKEKKEKQVIAWGTGSARREFIFSDDAADAAVFLMNNYNGRDIVNLGTGRDISIKELIEVIKGIVGYEGKIIFDTSKPDGAPRKMLDISRLNSLGWKARTSLEEGIKQTYEWFKENLKEQELCIKGRF